MIVITLLWTSLSKREITPLAISRIGAPHMEQSKNLHILHYIIRQITSKILSILFCNFPII